MLVYSDSPFISFLCFFPLSWVPVALWFSIFYFAFCCLGCDDARILPHCNLFYGILVVEILEILCLVWLLTVCLAFIEHCCCFTLKITTSSSTKYSPNLSCLFFGVVTAIPSWKGERIFSLPSSASQYFFLHLYCDFLLSILPNKIFFTMLFSFPPLNNF